MLLGEHNPSYPNTSLDPVMVDQALLVAAASAVLFHAVCSHCFVQ